MQGEQTLPQLSQALGLDLREDVLTQNSYDGLGDAAAGIYEEYDYGYGEHKEGVTLTILLEAQDGDTYRMVDENDWCVYARLSDERGNGQELSGAVYDAVQPYMAARAWNGEDMTMSAVALTQAVDAMAETAEDYIRTNCPPAGSGEDAGLEEPVQGSVTMQYVFDVADLLPYEKWENLEARAEAISQKQDCGVYFALVDDYTEFGNGSIYEVTYQLYHGSELGMGSGRDGIIVLLSMAERNYAMFVYGEYAEYAFDEYGKEKLEDGQEYAYSYSGIWRMEGDCLHLDLSDGAGTRMSGSFPVLIDPSGESLHIQQDRETGVCPPFFGEGMTCMDLIRAYG